MVPGSNRGTHQGFPTANILTDNEILPPDGVIRNPKLRTVDTVSQEKGMDLITPDMVMKKILKY